MYNIPHSSRIYRDSNLAITHFLIAQSFSKYCAHDSNTPLRKTLFDYATEINSIEERERYI